jgi:2-amino-4-hydroxy-6-hydroxymethyldihydropteridine diphosphokinase
MAIAFLMLGSNIGDKLANLLQATKALGGDAGEILKASSIYESEPWGFIHPDLFYNQVLILQTNFNAEELLSKILEIEEGMGRTRNKKDEYQARTIDIDILLYNNQIIQTQNLTVPHPKIAERRFVLLPLMDMNPELLHPVSGLTIWQMFRECGDKLSVKRLKN